MNVICVGSGAREHAIVRSLVKDGAKLTAIMDKKNPGITRLAEKVIITPLKAPWDLEDLNAEFCVIGPEGPLAEGLANYLEDKHNIPCIGPRKAVARLETSKIFARTLLEKHNIDGNPPFKVCSTTEEVKEFLQDFPEVAIKPDVLTGGKGVKITGDHLKSSEEVIQYTEERMKTDGKVVVEEKLVGQEFTLQALWDGRTLSSMPLVQDFKRLLDDDKGPNTGSMGSYSLPNHKLSFLEEEHIKKATDIMIKSLQAAQKDTGETYRGVLYGQFMVSEEQVSLIEFNCRYGDPEAMNVLPLLETNSLNMYYQMVEKKLEAIKFQPKATVCVYLVPKGYPTNPEKDKLVEIPSELQDSIYYASVYEKEGKIYTTGSRALAVLGVGPSVPEARNNAYKMISNFGDSLFHRTDIAAKIV